MSAKLMLVVLLLVPAMSDIAAAKWVTVTGGAFPVLSEEEAQLYRQPLIPDIDRVPTDPCGRPQEDAQSTLR